MDKKTKEVLGLFGPKKILADLLSVGDEAAARAFIEKYGPLHPKRATVHDVLEAADVFRVSFSAKTADEMEVAARFVEMIFTLPVEGDYARPASWDRPTIRVDFDAGRWEPVPRTLVDALAVELVRSRKNLHRCERPECGRYFVKEFSRDRYCSNLCSEDMRSRGQKEWAQRNRDELNKRGRKRRTK